MYRRYASLYFIIGVDIDEDIVSTILAFANSKKEIEAKMPDWEKFGQS